MTQTRSDAPRRPRLSQAAGRPPHHGITQLNGNGTSTAGHPASRVTRTRSGAPRRPRLSQAAGRPPHHGITRLNGKGTSTAGHPASRVTRTRSDAPRRARLSQAAGRPPHYGTTQHRLTRRAGRAGLYRLQAAMQRHGGRAGSRVGRGPPTGPIHTNDAAAVARASAVDSARPPPNMRGAGGPPPPRVHH